MQENYFDIKIVPENRLKLNQFIFYFTIFGVQPDNIFNKLSFKTDFFIITS